MKTLLKFTLYFRILFAVALAYLVSWFVPQRREWIHRDPCPGNDTVPNHYVKKFDDDMKLSSQQKRSRLEAGVMADYSIVGTSKSFDTLGESEAQPVTGRMQDIQYSGGQAGRRWIDLADFDWADYIDSFDKLKVLEDPTNKYVISGTAAMNRKKDAVIISALGGSARETTMSGITETSSLVALPTAQKVAVGGTNMSMAKLRTGLELLNAAEAGSPEEGGQRFFAYTANQLTKLMADSTLTSSDYNTLKALQDYNMTDRTFMGMTWIRSELLPKTINDRYCYIWAKEGVGFGCGENVTTDVSQRKDKRGLPFQTYLKQSIGAVRGKDDCVVEIACLETA